MAELVFRRLAHQDARRAADIVSAGDRTYAEVIKGWQQTPYEQDLEEWRRVLADPARWNIGAATPQGEVLGVLSMHPVRDDPGTGHLSALFVDPRHRGTGVGASLLARCEREWGRRGMTKGHLWTPRGAPAEHFYAHMGWRRDGTIHWLEWANMHVVGFVKPLAGGR